MTTKLTLATFAALTVVVGLAPGCSDEKPPGTVDEDAVADTTLDGTGDGEVTPDVIPDPGDAADVKTDDGGIDDGTTPETSDGGDGELGDAEIEAEVADAEVIEDVGPDGPPKPNPEPFPQSVLDCDAGDEAWVSRALQAVYGRRPHSANEVRVWAQLIAQSDRSTVLDTMMRDDAYVERYNDFLMDALRINRVGDKKHDECYGLPFRPADAGELAEFVRDNPATTAGGMGAFNMTDLIRSSLRLDDVSPVYRAHLLAMMHKPITGANVDALEMDITRRKDFGENFEDIYLHRKSTCMPCHNSTYSVTGDDDPALDRTWEIPGHFETAIFEFPQGRPEMEVFALLRRLGITTESFAGRRPWGWTFMCGRIWEEEDQDPDPIGTDGYFIEPRGTTSNVWQLEAALADGFAKLREDGLDLDEETLEVGGNEAFAYLTSANLANQVWKNIMGYPLTIANYFPRNRQQRDALWEMTEKFIASDFSMKELVRYVVLDPRFNQKAPEEGCGDSDGYYMRPVFDPWTIHEDDPTIQGNSVGDQLVRLPARTLLRSTAQLLLWPESSAFPSGSEELLQVAIGAFTKDAEPGFRGVDFQGLLTWEDRYGMCSQPITGDLTGPGCQPKGGPGCDGCSCEACVCAFDAYCCDNQWDAQCVNECNNDCEGCDVEGVPEDAQDFIYKVVDAVQTQAAAAPDDKLTLEQVVRVLKERIIQQPWVEPAEAPLLESLLGAPLDSAAADHVDLDDALRTLCGVLVSTPQFMLFGTPPALPPVEDPPIDVAGMAFAEECETIRLIWDSTQWNVTCDAAAVTLEVGPAPVPDEDPDADADAGSTDDADAEPADDAGPTDDASAE